MVVMTYKKIRDFEKRHPQFFEALDNWYSITEKANWRNFHDVKNVFNSADAVGRDLYVFNVRGNQLRIVVKIVFRVRTVFIKFIGTHAEYDKLDLRRL
jgi:mRNA interferase HigB